MSRSGVRYQGEVIEWDGGKGCGFIRPRGSGPADPVVFLHAKSFVSRGRSPKLGDTVVYEVETAPETPQSKRLRTRQRARNVTFQGEELPQTAPQDGKAFGIFAAFYLAALFGVALLVPAAIWLALSSVALSLIALGQYAWDKDAANSNARRVPEDSLNLIAFLGGWPGAVAGQQLFRHKTRKHSFQVAFRIAVGANVAAVCLAVFAMAR